jgi:hypothetical protein
VDWPGRRALAGVKDWLKFKNPAAPAVKREAEEDWGKLLQTQTKLNYVRVMLAKKRKHKGALK